MKRSTSPSSLPPSSAARALSPGSSVFCPLFFSASPSLRSTERATVAGPASLSGWAKTKKKKKKAAEIIAGTCKFPHRHFCLVLVPFALPPLPVKKADNASANGASVSRAALTSGDKLKGRLQRSRGGGAVTDSGYQCVSSIA